MQAEDLPSSLTSNNLKWALSNPWENVFKSCHTMVNGLCAIMNALPAIAECRLRNWRKFQLKETLAMCLWHITSNHCRFDGRGFVASDETCNWPVSAYVSLCLSQSVSVGVSRCQLKSVGVIAVARSTSENTEVHKTRLGKVCVFRNEYNKWRTDHSCLLSSWV